MKNKHPSPNLKREYLKKIPKEIYKKYFEEPEPIIMPFNVLTSKIIYWIYIIGIFLFSILSITSAIWQL